MADEPPPRIVAIIIGLAAFFAVFFLIIAVPLSGVLIRFRANYTPKRIRLVEDDEDDNDRSRVGQVEDEISRSTVTSYWGMLRRTIKLEGWGGLFKGMMPGLLSGLVIGVISSILGTINLGGKEHNAILYAKSIFVAVFGIPFVAIINRATVTPVRLPWFGWNRSKRQLLSPREQRSIMSLYFLPGLAITQFLLAAYVQGPLLILRTVLNPTPIPISGPNTIQWPSAKEFNWLHAGLYFLLLVVSVAIICPLEVISIRLSLQRKEDEIGEGDTTAPAAGVNKPMTVDVPASQGEGEGVVRESVVEVRDVEKSNAYTGMIDCGKKIVREEGFKALYRAWWATFLSVLFVGAASRSS